MRRAFVLANRAFARARDAGACWFLFQLVFIVTELGALAGRERPDDPRLRRELNAVDVLWFPTGGGKTEAYLGLILVALFYDRLRGKLRGVTAWMLFPLRMLSVQQLARISDVLHHADIVRHEEQIDGQPFSLGYLVGANDTRNRLAYANNWWPGLQAFASWAPEARNLRRLVGRCPQCKEPDSVCLEADLSASRLLHRCESCGHVLAIYASDEEIARFQPSAIVSTVDKVTSFSFNPQFTAFTHGPRRSCPEHGWYTHSKCMVKDCTTNPSKHGSPVGFYDPVPALWIQDELHLVREELVCSPPITREQVPPAGRERGLRAVQPPPATATISSSRTSSPSRWCASRARSPPGDPLQAQLLTSSPTSSSRSMSGS